MRVSPPFWTCDGHTGFSGLCSFNTCIRQKFHTAAGQACCKEFRELPVFDGQDGRHHLDDGDLRAERIVEGRELDPDRSGTDDDHGLGTGRKRHRFGAGDDPFPVDRDIRERTRPGTRGQDDVRSLDRGGGLSFGTDLERVRGGEARRSRDAP